MQNTRVDEEGTQLLASILEGTKSIRSFAVD